jgi:hypothetical protein
MTGAIRKSAVKEHFPQIRKRVLLRLIHPARHCNEQKVEWIRRRRHRFIQAPGPNLITGRW